MRVRSSFWFFLGVAGLAFIVAWYTGRYSTFPGSRVVFFRLAALSLMLIIMNWIWTIIAVRKLTVIRTQRLLRLQVGNVFEERFELDNPSRFWRLWVEISDSSRLPGAGGSKVLSRVGPRQDRFYISRIILINRGAFDLGPTIIRSGDPFGMFLSEKSFPAEKKLVVLPYMIPLKHIPELPGFLSGGRAIRHKSLEATSYASGVREYQPGDPLSRIHWRSSAKQNRFMIKEFDQDPQSELWILIDSNQKSNYSRHEKIEKEMPDAFWAWKNQEEFKLPADTFEYIISVSASLANYYIYNEKSVGFACADSGMTVISSEKGERQLGKIMETLAFLEGKGDLPINGLVESISSMIPRGSTVILISSNSMDNIQFCIEVLLRKHLNPIIILIDKESFIETTDESGSYDLTGFHQVPVAVIRYGDNIAERIESQIL
jgi:uncharacterized protein (DUF58 family)